jgi:hypothetical protein
LADAHDHRNVGVILKLLNVNAFAEHLAGRSYAGPVINVADDPLLRDVKLAVKSDRTKLVLTKKFMTKGGGRML